ncbi:hypothetical protein EGW08_005635 [Elysia chlorotica]|uniref:Uncharacterized protein n=1 Tax=Elysia chlorotica TaxID=188477 RepID=A0A3S1BQZ8_ELYCH|nr:hypothetical protein EGW08_005635 [Elysia chlorotica]
MGSCGRQGDVELWETGRWGVVGDREMWSCGRQGDGELWETGRWGDREIGRWTLARQACSWTRSEPLQSGNSPRAIHAVGPTRNGRPIHGRTYVPLNSDPEDQGRALTQVIGQYNMKQTAVLVEDSRLADGFLTGVRQVISARRQDVFFLQTLSSNDSSDTILDKLVEISNVGWKVILLHTSPSLMLRVVTSALSTRLYKTGHAWFLSEAAYTRDPDVLRHLPDGLLAIDSFWLGGLRDVMATSLEHVLEAVTCLLLSQSNSVPYPNNGTDWLNNTSGTQDQTAGSENPYLGGIRNGQPKNLDYLKYSHNISSNNNSTNSSFNTMNLQLVSLRSTLDFVDTFKSCLHQVARHSCADAVTNTSSSKSSKKTTGTANTSTYGEKINTNNPKSGPSDKSFPSQSHLSASGKTHTSGSYQSGLASSSYTSGDGDMDQTVAPVTECQKYTGPAFFLVNTIRDAKGLLMWSTVGHITASGDRRLRTVLWPGHNIYGPSSSSVKTYRVVMRPAEPFMYISRQSVTAKEECSNNVPCLQVDNSSQSLVKRAIDDFQTYQKLVGKLYTLHCCKGLSLDMLDRLSIDLNFRYVLYFVNDTNYGTLSDGAWTGMVGDVINDVADVVIGAFSMTAARMSVMDFTEPFYKNEFALITGEDGIYVSIWAFMSPFSGQVWLCIMLSSIVAGIATSILEWHSPFGLNPIPAFAWFLMPNPSPDEYQYHDEWPAPKSWPGKVIQNVWAGLAIFIMTSYTANLAAYLAGQSVVTTVNSVFDPEVLSLYKLSIVFLPFLHFSVVFLNGLILSISISSLSTSIFLSLAQQKVDVYMDDMPLLEYGLARYDDTCNVRFAGKGFGSDGYAFGLPRFSWLKIPMSNQIRKYTESGFIQELAAKYLSRPHCENFLTGTAKPYGLEHTGGLFIILVSAMLLSVVFLILEHLAYHYLVPWLRRQPAESFWKRESFAFISQRVFRVVRSERLYSQKQAAQEMIKIVKQRDFTRLIQKNELQKRKMPTQKRVKTKAEVFQEITANIVSYHRQMQSASEERDTIDGSDLDESSQTSAIQASDERPWDPAPDGINNAAFTGSSSKRRQEYRTSTMLSIDDDDNVVFLEDSLPEDVDHHDFWAGLRRKGSSRSFVLNPSAPPEGSQKSPPRKFSDSLYPRWIKPQQSPYVLPLSARFHNTSSREYISPAAPQLPKADTALNIHGDSHGSLQTDMCRNHVPRILNSVETLNTARALPEDGEPTPHSGTDGPPRSAVTVPDLLPSEDAGWLYYYSPTSSSNQTLSEERREFSPLSSPATPHTDEEFPGCAETSFTDSVSSLNPGHRVGTNSSSSPNYPHQTTQHHHNHHQQQKLGFEPKSPSQTARRDICLDPVRLSSTSDLTQLSPVHEEHPLQTGRRSALNSSQPEPNTNTNSNPNTNTNSNPNAFSPATLEIDQKFGHHSAPSRDQHGSSGRKKDKSNTSALASSVPHGSSQHGEPCRIKRNNSAVFTIEEEPRGRGLLKMSDKKQNRRASLDSDHVSNARKSRALGDYFRRNLRLKKSSTLLILSAHDQEQSIRAPAPPPSVKWTLRSHAMSGYQSQLPVDYIDECTLEALSKEDLLILWKKSELDLESRLHEVLARNRRLSLAIDYLSRPDNMDLPGDV